MAVVITGAAGFIGSALVAELTERGEDVHAVVHPRTDLARLGAVLDRSRHVELHVLDLHDVDALAAVLRRYEPLIVFHAAAKGGHGDGGHGDGGPRAARTALWEDTLGATLALLDALDGLPVRRLVNLGSSLQYAPADRPLRETDPCAPVAVRGAAKQAASVALWQWAAEHEVPTTELRIFRAFGPNEQEHRLVPAVLRALDDGSVVPVPDAVTRRDFIYIDDVVDACALAAVSPQAAGEVLNVGFGRSHDVDEVISAFEEVTGRQIPTARGEWSLAAHDLSQWQADMTKTCELLDWRPTIDLRRGIEMVVKDHLAR